MPRKLLFDTDDLEPRSVDFDELADRSLVPEQADLRRLPEDRDGGARLVGPVVEEVCGILT